MGVTFPWKRNLKTIPDSVVDALDRIDSDLITVAATKIVTLSEVAAGLYEHIGLRTDGIQLYCSGPVIPPSSSGKWSARSTLGWDRVRKDWPLVTKSWAIESPNFGDGLRNGWSTRIFSKEVYQHQVFEPIGLTIDTEILRDSGTRAWIVRFLISPPLSKSMSEFDLMLLWWLNVLQENTGTAGVFPSTATTREYLDTISLDWEIFPPGTADEVVEHFMKSGRSIKTIDIERHIRERVELFGAFSPIAYIKGQGGFGSYFGAKFADDLVVFENLRYGNAMYLLYQDWEVVARRSRYELLRDEDANFDRVTHGSGWQKKVSALLHEKLFERGLIRRRSTRATRRRRF